MLELSNITKSFENTHSPILKGINLKLEKGDFCVIIGSNGSGKSTFMRIISGEYNIDEGNIKINNQNISLNDRSKYIAQIVQDTARGTISEMTLLENIALSQMRIRDSKMLFYKRYQNEIIKKIRDLNMGLEKYIDQPVSVLSGGQRQIIATFMAINSAPEILLLDEHTSALDPKMQNELMEYTASSITRNKITSLMITHKMDDAIKYGNRLIMLNSGKIVFEVSKEDKAKLNISDLIELFHKYEDKNMVRQNDN